MTATPRVFPVESEDAWLDRMPALAAPFAIVGASAGLFSVLALGAIRQTARQTQPLLAMVVAALAGAVAGAVLRRWRRLHEPMLAHDAWVMRVAVVVLSAGGATGAVVGVTTWGPDGILLCALGGVLLGLLFLPSCLVVLAAARRAGRARHGSLVAGADQRTVYATLLGAVVFAASMQAPAVASAQFSKWLPDSFQVALSVLACGASLGAIAWLRLLDRRARTELAAIANDAAWLDEVAPNGLASRAAMDLGLGDERWARRGVATYRTAVCGEIVLVGSVDDAILVLDEAVARRHRMLSIAAVGLVLAAWSFTCGATLPLW